jgi:transcriptional regulator with XRE-family HTH domain
MSGWGHKLRSFRRQMNLKQQTLAELLSTSQGYVSRLEADLVEPNVETRVRIEKLLGAPQNIPLIQHLCRAVESSPNLVCINGLPLGKNTLAVSAGCGKDKAPYTAESSKSHEQFPGMDEFWDRLKTLQKLGFFEGNIASAECLWRGKVEGKERVWRTITMPIRTPESEWVAHSTCMPISNERFVALEREWSGKINVVRQ